MADHPKKKTNVSRNDERKNGKRFKSHRRSHRSGRGVRLTELQKALLGGGVMRRIKVPVPGGGNDE